MEFIENLSHEEKYEILRTCRLKNAFKPDGLSKKKFKPDLNLFSIEATKALRLRHGDEAKGTQVFLEVINIHVAQLLTTTDPKKIFLVPEAKPFFHVK